MSLWTDLATWRGPTVNQGGRMVEQRGVIVHIAEGSFEGTISWQKNPAADVSSHFVVDYDGRIAQVVDTDTAAWTQAAGNGHWLSIENAGFHTDQLTPQQVEANAQILARAHREYGVALQLAGTPAGYGLGWHGMGGAAWGGHTSCPGPNNVALLPTILARAIEILTGGDEMSVESEIDAFNASSLMFALATGAASATCRYRWTGDGHQTGDEFQQTLQPYWNVVRGQSEPLTPEELAAVTAAAQAGAEAGAPTHEELVAAAQEGAELASDS